MSGYLDQSRVFLMNRATTYVPMRHIANYRRTISFDDMFDHVQKIAPNGVMPPHFNEIIEVPGLESGKCRWFSKVDNSTPEDPVSIFFHGGGYAFSFEWQHITFIDTVARYGINKRMSIVWLDYTSSTKAPFPKQLLEALATYEAVAKISQNLLIMGDSAGGHSSLSLSRHLHEPFPEVPPVQTKVRPTTLIAISPWSDIQPGEPEEKTSWQENMYKDVFTHHGINGFGEMILRGAENVDSRLARDIISMHRRSDSVWQEILPKNVSITYGGKEVLKDSIEEFIKVADIETTQTVFHEPDSIHDSPVLMPLEDNATVQAISSFLDRTSQ